MVSRYEYSASAEKPILAPQSGCTADTGSARTSFRILFIIDQLVEMGGAELAMMRLVRSLPLHGIQPHVLTFKEILPDAVRENFPCPLTVVPLSRAYGLGAMRAAVRIRSLIVSRHFKLVHTFFETSDLFGGLVVKSIPGVALVSSRRDMGILRSAKHRLAYRCLGRLADRVVTVSDRVREWCIREDHVAPQRVVTVYNGVEDVVSNATPARRQTRAYLGLLPDQLAVIAVGHLRHVKGFDLLIEAAHRLVASHPNAIFLIAGEEHEKGRRATLEAMIDSLNLKANVKLLGPRSDITDILAASDIFLLPSRSEGFSNALIEAMMAGLPCVATNVGGNAEAVVNGRTGYIVPAEAPVAMEDSLALLLSSRSRRERMGRAGRELALERFTHSTMVKTMVTLYRGALQ
jgi:glycosyltransferase involved in cell wall biosynthesis